MDMSTAKNVAFAVFLLGTACLIFANRKRLRSFLQPEKKKKSQRSKKKTGNAMTEVCQTFLMYAENFQGLYEPMYRASIGAISQERMMNVLAEWDIRMNNIGQDAVCLKSWWATVITNCDRLSNLELQDRSRLVVEMIQSCGIIRDDLTEMVAKKDTGMYYHLSDGDRLLVGQQLRIESPCWYLPSCPVRVIEKGYCEIIK